MTHFQGEHAEKVPLALLLRTFSLSAGEEADHVEGHTLSLARAGSGDRGGRKTSRAGITVEITRRKIINDQGGGAGDCASTLNYSVPSGLRKDEDVLGSRGKMFSPSIQGVTGLLQVTKAASLLSLLSYSVLRLPADREDDWLAIDDCDDEGAMSLVSLLMGLPATSATVVTHAPERLTEPSLPTLKSRVACDVDDHNVACHVLHGNGLSPRCLNLGRTRRGPRLPGRRPAVNSMRPQQSVPQ
ncbi:hypothetical protein BJV78DRAFT_1355351 [Lactifluus subvellereus]|nr:hypothetical protein BJV78DRAFT_1355351 [Lactifluus subvellereus]